MATDNLHRCVRGGVAPYGHAVSPCSVQLVLWGGRSLFCPQAHSTLRPRLVPGRCNVIQEWVKPRLFAGRGELRPPGQGLFYSAGGPTERAWITLQGLRLWF